MTAVNISYKLFKGPAFKDHCSNKGHTSHLSVSLFKRSVGDETGPETDKAKGLRSLGGPTRCYTDGGGYLTLQSHNGHTAGGLNKRVFVCGRSDPVFLIVVKTGELNLYSLLSRIFGLSGGLAGFPRLNGVGLKTH